MKKILFILTIIFLSLTVYSCDFSNENQEVQELIELINDLPEVITLDDEDAINNCFNKFNLLSSEYKNLLLIITY